MLRTMLESLISDKTGAEKKALKVELKIPAFQNLSLSTEAASNMPNCWISVVSGPSSRETQPIAKQGSCNHSIFLYCYYDLINM